MIPDLASYDFIVVNTSAGKDSQVMMDEIVRHADEAGVRNRLVAVHADLGRVEWEGTRDLAEEHAGAYGIRFLAVARPQGDLLDHVESRGMWPSSTTRYCTSDHKRGQVAKVLTSLTKEVRDANGGRQARLLNCMGFRADESPARAKRAVFMFDERASNGRRHVDQWLPVHSWTVEDVWERIGSIDTEAHWAYAAGMPRLSCCFCVLASKSALVRAAQLVPDLAAEYAALEVKIGHRFRMDLSMAEIITDAARTEVSPVEAWAA